MCNFHKLAFTNHGYVVSCIDCGHYQLAFGTALLTLTNNDFKHLLRIVTIELNSITENDACCSLDDTKNIIITTPSNQCCFILTRTELQLFYEILDNADTEIKALLLLKLFDEK